MWNAECGIIIEYDVVVIGGGPAGMAAALGAAELRSEAVKESVVRGQGSGDEIDVLRVALIERAERLGGILNQCTHTGFGLSYFGEELTGQEYARRFVERIESSEVEVLTDTMVMDIGADHVVSVSGVQTGFRRVRAKVVVLATGCRERPIGALPVTGSRPSGVFTAGAAQKMINLGGYDLGNRFVILGSGDVGLIVARELAKRGKDVIAVIEKEAKCGGLSRNRINCLEQYGIPLLTHSTVSKVHGMPRVSGVTVMHSEAGQESGDGDTGIQNNTFIECDTLITSVGLIPERELYSHKVNDWLFVCGNADYVHAIVDSVTVESEKIGRSAAIAALHPIINNNVL